MNSPDVIHIAFAANDNYAKLVGVAMASLKDRQRSASSVQVHLLDGGILPHNLDKLNQLSDEHLCINIYKGNVEEYAGYLVLEHFSSAMYLRLSLENILSGDIDRVIYCDCDVIFLRPLDELWNMDLNNFWMAAVADYVEPLNHWRKDLGIEQPGRYFNSGIMLIDLKEWRKNQVSAQVKDYLRSHWDKLRYPDQDGLNAILYQHWLPLDISWNTFSGTVKDRKAVPDPHIVHFASAIKPWFYKSVDVYQEDFLGYLRQTPWRDYKFPDKNIVNWFRRKLLLYGPDPLIKWIQYWVRLWQKSVADQSRQKALKRIKS